MAYGRSKSVRFQDDVELTKITNRGNYKIDLEYKFDGTHISEPSSKKVNRDVPEKIVGSFRSKLLPRVFSEDHERKKKRILDPRGTVIRRWNRVFFGACLISLFLDPMFAYLPEVEINELCVAKGMSLKVALTIIRSIADLFYFINIFIRFRTAYVAPSLRVFGRGELVIDPTKIALRYFARSFWIDLVAALPLPQVLIWAIIPNLSDSTILTTIRNLLVLVIIFQYLPRLILVFPLSSQIAKSTGVMTNTAWAGAAYNLMLFVLSGHVLGACFYLLQIDRQESCWRKVCRNETSCNYSFFDCHEKDNPSRVNWFNSSNVSTLCIPGSTPNQGFVEFGIYGNAINLSVANTTFSEKYLYCQWWGLMNLSSLGQNMTLSTYVGELMFAMTVPILGLVLFALVIGNIQTYLQSNSTRLEEWRNKASDAEQWMRHRQLSHDLRQSVRRYGQYRWIATQGVDEEALLRGLPFDFRRDIKRHLCLELVRQVPLFDQIMDERMLDAICERLKPALRTQGACLVREGDLVNEMIFIIRGHLDSYTTDGGRTGFFNSCRIGPGDFCGEELLTWALDPRPSVILPSSTRTVKAISEVEAFVLSADDLKFVAAQFRKLHSQQLRDTFRFHSHQWRTWAVCYIQAAWRRFKRRKEMGEGRAGESSMETSPEHDTEFEQMGMTLLQPGMSLAATFASRLAASTRRRIGGNRNPVVVSSYQKPADPDFTIEEE